MVVQESLAASAFVGWTEHDAGSRSAGWADPLGLRAEAGGIAGDLVPVFRRRHNTPEQFGLLCYGMRKTSRDPVSASWQSRGSGRWLARTRVGVGRDSDEPI